MNEAPLPADRTGRLAALRARIRTLEGRGQGFATPPVRLGPALDPLLAEEGLARRALHELAGPASTLFALAIARAALDRPGLLVWCLDEAGVRARGLPWPPGLAARGLDPSRLLLVRAPDATALARAVEEALSSPAAAVVLGELARVSFDLSRRLQLAVERGGGIGLLLRPAADPTPSAAATRWWAEPAPGCEGPVRLRLELRRAKSGARGQVEVRVDERTLALHPAAALADPAAAAACPAERRALARS
jgi:protein ImuA